MKKMKIIIGVTVLLTMLTACSTEGLEIYNDASIKTSNESKGKTSCKINMDIDFNTDDLTLEEIRQLNYAKKMIFEITSSYDSSKGKVASDIYLNLGGVGMDSNYYRNGNEGYVKIPVLNKYIDIDEGKEIVNTKEYGSFFSTIEESWLELLEEDDVVKGENTIIDTEEGQVKATIVTININEALLKKYAEKITYILMDSDIINKIVDVNYDSAHKEKLRETLTRTLKKIQFEDFKTLAYIDFDGYLIKEEISMRMKMADANKGEPLAMSISITNENWDIGKEQNIEIPEIKEQLIKIEELKNMDNIFELK
ncbi:MAG: hypothetical protein N4A50_10960 [Vallitalea sp.]|jgi:hypothetical protein|nr:hypothetical protein [Vallitalea sp.]